MLKSLFNLETNSTVDLPNQYFLVLQKEEKYKQLTANLQKLKYFNRKFIDSASTIKITLSQLVNDFFKHSGHSFTKKVELALLATYESIQAVCLNLYRKIEIRLFNYQSQISKLNKKYKEVLEQLIHYRKKVQSIKKGSLQTRDQKQRLQRNIEKKRSIQQQCQKVEKLLVKNYESFQSQVEIQIKTIPQSILVQFIEGNLSSYSKLSQLIEAQFPAIRNHQRRQSLVSSAVSQISQIEDIIILSELSEEQEQKSYHDVEIVIEAEPQSQQTIQNDSKKKQLNIKKYEGHLMLEKNIISPKQQKVIKNHKKPLLKKVSIEDKISIKTNLIQKFKRILDIQTENLSSLNNSRIVELQKAFEKIQAPLLNQEKIGKIFESIQNKYSGIDLKIDLKKHLKRQNRTLKFQDQNHQKSFVLQKSEFRNKHSPTYHRRSDFSTKQQLKKQETLNDLPDRISSSSSSQKKQQSNVSLSFIIKKQKSQNISSQNNRKRNSQYIPQKHNRQMDNQIKQPSIRSFYEKPQYVKLSNQRIIQDTDLIKQPNINSLSTPTIENIKQKTKKVNHEKKNQPKLAEEQKKKVIEHLFSVSTLKKKDQQKKQKNNEMSMKSSGKISQKTKQTDSKYWFSSSFLTPKQNNNFKAIKYNFSSIFREKQQIVEGKKIINGIQGEFENKVDFSIFSNII